MMVRTYGRRNRGGVSLNDGVHDSLSQENDTEEQNDNNNHNNHRISSSSSLPSFLSSQESSSHWSFDFDPYDLDSSQSQPQLAFDDVVPRQQKKARVSSPPVKKRGFSPPARGLGPSIPATSTLMEAQEFGEMMEHVDEVNFALDGLRKNQPVRIRRASLLSLLSIGATQHQRRHLRTQGMVKTIVDALLGLSFDDSPSNLAAAALLYVLTSDGQDDHLLEAPNCIRFLIRLLKPIASFATEEKLPRIGNKLLAIRTSVDNLNNANKRVDSSSAAILSKVEELLISCKDIKPNPGISGIERPELCPKWIALLTIERACLSTISLEETSGTVRKSGGIFKEKLRELGGLDAVFEVATKCNSDMESLMEVRLPFTPDTKVDVDMRCLSLLLKCLRIMENATFLSKDNQSHLLRMKRRASSTEAPISYTELVINAIKILSDISITKASSDAATDSKSSTQSKGDVNEDLYSDSSRSNLETIYSENSFDIWQDGQFVAASQFENPSIETASTSMSENNSSKSRLNSSTSSGLCRQTSLGLSIIKRGSKNPLRKDPDIVQKLHGSLALLDESQDPFAFDEDDVELSKWDVLSGKKPVSGTKQSELTVVREFDGGSQSRMLTSQEESSNGGNDASREASSTVTVDDESSILLADCLLSAVKALMNVTNDNPVGCRQIAAKGGLETMCSLIACHFPSFSSSSSSMNNTNHNALIINLDGPDDRPLTDQELDFLVAILGLLVNLVEKDSENRSRLASASVQLRNSGAIDDMCSKDVIPLLCSIFLANHGAGEAIQDGKEMPCDEEEAVLQGEKEAEKMILEAYAALLLAFLSTESKGIREAIIDCLPERKLAILVPVLERFVAFHLSLNMISPETHKAVSEVIESCRRR